MKRAYLLLLTLVLILTGCGGRGEANDVSVKDVCCPYEINHKKEVVEIKLRDGDQSGILWNVETVPEEICQVTQETNNDEFTSRFRLSGLEPGAAKVTFTARQPDETVSFVLTLVASVDAEGKTVVTSCQHHESGNISVEADGLNYKWNVDVDGVLHFSFLNEEDYWSASGDGADGFSLSDIMSTSTGCKFSVQATAAGQMTITLTGESSQRTIHVVIGSDEAGRMEVVSVEEQ